MKKKSIIINSLNNSKRYLTIIPILSAIITYLKLQIPMCIKYGIDGIAFGDINVIPNYLSIYLTQETIQNIFVLCLYLLLLYLCVSGFSYVRDQITSKFTLKVNYNVRMEIFKHIQNLEYASYYSYDKNEMLQRIRDDANVFSNFFNTSLNLILDSFFVVIYVVYQGIQLNGIITSYIIISVIIIVLFGVWYFKKLGPKIGEMVKSNRNLLAKTTYCVDYFKILRMFNKQRKETNEHEKLNEYYIESQRKFINLVLFHEIITDHISYLTQPIIFTIGGILVMKRTTKLGNSYCTCQFCTNGNRVFYSFRKWIR